MNHERATRTGRIRLEERHDEELFVVTPVGHVGPALVRFDLERARHFGLGHPDGWWYVVDTTSVLLPNPLNVRHLRRIRRLPNLSGYVVIAPGGPLRAVAQLLAPISRPDAVVRTREQALALVREDRSHG